MFAFDISFPTSTFTFSYLALKILDTVGNCQKPVFPLGVSQHYSENNKPVKNSAQLVKLRQNIGRKNTLVAQVVWFQMLDFETSLRSRIHFKYFSEKLLLPQNLCYFRGSPFSHKVLYYQQFSFARYQVRFYANIYFG